MGWKISMIIIEDKNDFNDDKLILEAIGKGDFQFEKALDLDRAMFQKDNLICIGYYNQNIIILDSYQITEKSLEKAGDLKLIKEEAALVNLFPNAEILTVACHSAMNYHGYSLVQNGEKIRLKTISSDDKLKQFGEQLDEEEEIYKTAYSKNGLNYWKDEEYPDDDDYTEDQLMEDFTFGIAKRRLGVRLDNSEANDLMKNIEFKKYSNSNTTSKIEKESAKEDKFMSNWKRYGLIFLIILIWQILKRFVFNN